MRPDENDGCERTARLLNGCRSATYRDPEWSVVGTEYLGKRYQAASASRDLIERIWLTLGVPRGGRHAKLAGDPRTILELAHSEEDQRRKRRERWQHAATGDFTATVRVRTEIDSAVRKSFLEEGL